MAKEERKSSDKWSLWPAWIRIQNSTATAYATTGSRQSDQSTALGLGMGGMMIPSRTESADGRVFFARPDQTITSDHRDRNCERRTSCAPPTKWGAKAGW